MITKLSAVVHYPVPLPATGLAIRARGLVQGVGFRPTVWRLAQACGLTGEVHNDAEGVLIHIWGEPEQRALFLRRLLRELPPLASLDSLHYVPLDSAAPQAPFRIIASRAAEVVHTGVVADAATCDACLREVRDAQDRRHAYAFANCTHCGPRLSIVRRIPYDRANTSMQEFAMCAACRREYENPADRRFHAQPIACADCGPRLWLEQIGETTVDLSGDPVVVTRQLLQAGHIVAIKGIGGIHLAVDASNAAAVERLRRRKQRLHKPFALLARDIATIRHYCNVNPAEEELLRQTAAPIVLLNADGPGRLAAAVAPGQHCYGFMLPYSPLHHLLMCDLEAPVVLTSANRSEEPQCISNDDARVALEDIADVLLLHDREIVNRLDDSVARMIAREPVLLRRARGYAPIPLPLPASFSAVADVLALGGELKSTFCLLKDGAAILSQHLGDLENASANLAYQQTLDLYLDMFDHRAKVLAVDDHPDYLPTRLGHQWATSRGTSLVSVQHHHAHIAACMADNGLELNAAPVLGIALDGNGYGADGALWGGEFLLADYCGYQRLASFAPAPMPGGVQAIRQPWRMTYAHLWHSGNWPALAGEYADLPFFQTVSDKPLATLEGMLKAGFNCPMTSSCGRLFDALAALLGLRYTVSYEGQAAIELEAAVDTASLGKPGYPFAVTERNGLPCVQADSMWRAVLYDLRERVPIGTIAARFHSGLAQAITAMVTHLIADIDATWSGQIALSGGVFQNAILSEDLIRRLEAENLPVLRHRNVPTNDGGLSLGQAVIAAAQTTTESKESVCA